MAAREPIRGVLFDKDGTLFDFAATWRGAAESVLTTLAKGDVDAARRIGDAVGFDPRTGAFAAGSPLVAGSTREVAEILAREVPGLEADALERAADAAAQAARPAPAAPDLPVLLDALKAAGLALGVATHDSAASARAHLAEAGALDRFDFIAGYDSGCGLKPGPGMVLAFAERAGIAAAAVAMVGDSLHDIGAARAAGAGLAIGVLTGPAPRSLLEPEADVVLDSIAALPEFLAGWASGPAVA